MLLRCFWVIIIVESITHSKCVYFASVTACCIIFSPVAWLAAPGYFHMTYKLQDFKKNICYVYRTCVLVFCKTFVCNFSHFKKMWTRCYHKLHGYLCKVPLFSSYFSETRIFQIDVGKMFKYQISWKSIQWELSCFMPTNGQKDWRRDVTNLIVAFRSFGNVLKMYDKVSCYLI